MFKNLSYKRFSELAENYKKIAVYQEIAGDKMTAVTAYLALAIQQTLDISLLESNPREENMGRYSYLFFNPVAKIVAFGNQVTISRQAGEEVITADPFSVLKQYQKEFCAKTDHALSGFAGGMIGYISYDAMRTIEDVPDRHDNKDNIPDMFFRSYRDNITFDHQTGKVVISTVVDVTDNVQANHNSAVEIIDAIIGTLLRPINNNDHSDLTSNHDIDKLHIETNTDDNAYIEIVNKAKQYIVSGDAYQIVPSREFSIKTSAAPFDIYRALKYCSPSPYMFYIEHNDFVIAGASPEKLISVRDGIIESRPLAGTRPRNEASNDESLINDLLSDEKEVAEHMMLVDLTRNDIGSVSEPGSVETVRLKEIEKYSRVMHISSTVQGDLRDDKDAIDALKASFPAGTLVGAPKIRAMEIIDELEHSRRGIYGGAICAFDSLGNLESCIAIRTTVIRNGVAKVRAGAGVVFDSQAQMEANETYHKASAILQSITLATGELQ